MLSIKVRIGNETIVIENIPKDSTYGDLKERISFLYNLPDFDLFCDNRICEDSEIIQTDLVELQLPLKEQTSWILTSLFLLVHLLPLWCFLVRKPQLGLRLYLVGFVIFMSVRVIMQRKWRFSETTPFVRYNNRMKDWPRLFLRSLSPSFRLESLHQHVD